MSTCMCVCVYVCVCVCVSDCTWRLFSALPNMLIYVSSTVLPGRLSCTGRRPRPS